MLCIQHSGACGPQAVKTEASKKAGRVVASLRSVTDPHHAAFFGLDG
jgi:hypothetical protein